MNMRLDIHQIENAKCLVETKTNKVICDETEYVNQFVLCSCQLTGKILKCQKYSEQKIAMQERGHFG